uniref:Uncharacterized protein n=1 Tax=Cacopsylla melanoneura TaxID=428564 RepID=A0A8D8U600_9HEMI
MSICCNQSHVFSYSSLYSRHCPTIPSSLSFFVLISLNSVSKFSARAFISLLTAVCPSGEVDASTTSPVVCMCSTSSSPCAFLLSNVSRGATMFSMASLSLKDFCFMLGILSRALVNQASSSSHASLYTLWSLY